VQEIGDLIVDVVELLVFGLDQFPPSIRTALFAVDLRLKFCLRLVLVVPKSSKLPAINQKAIFSRTDRSEMLLSEVNAGDIVSVCSIFGFDFIGRPNFIPVIPADLNEYGLFIYGPIDQ
jgi:hypothetical protein